MPEHMVADAICMRVSSMTARLIMLAAHYLNAACNA
jgi:hypothetical protein